MLVQVLSMSVDPYLRSQIKSEASFPGSTGGKRPGEVMEGFVSGKILASKSPAWVEGVVELVVGVSLVTFLLQAICSAPACLFQRCRL